MKTLLLDFLFPQRCCGCGQAGPLLCESCAGSLHCVPPSCFVCKQFVPAGRHIPAGRTCKNCRPYTSVYGFFSPLLYQEVSVANIIRAFKYQRATDAAPLLADMLARAIRIYDMVIPPDALLIPVPLHPSRKRARGFNQAQLLAEHLGLRIDREISLTILVCRKEKRAQALLGGDERRSEIWETFAVRSPEYIQGRTICVIDDVKTTGATIAEAARVLKAAGAKRILAITAAH